MDAFVCHACGKTSRVRQVKVDAGQTYLVCSHCSADHLLRKVFGSPGLRPDVEIVGLRGHSLENQSRVPDGRDRY